MTLPFNASGNTVILMLGIERRAAHLLSEHRISFRPDLPSTITSTVRNTCTRLSPSRAAQIPEDFLSGQAGLPMKSRRLTRGKSSPHLPMTC